MGERIERTQGWIGQAVDHDVYALIGRRIREARQKHQLSLEELAERSELTPAFLGQIERGDRKLSVAALDKVAGALHLSPDDLMRRSAKARKVSWEERIASLLHKQPAERKMLIFKMLKCILKCLRH